MKKQQISATLNKRVFNANVNGTGYKPSPTANKIWTSTAERLVETKKFVRKDNGYWLVDQKRVEAAVAKLQPVKTK